MADGRKNNGGARPGSGRPPKTEEQKVVEQVGPLVPEAIEALKRGIERDESWAVIKTLEYAWGRPKQSMEQKIEFKEQPLFPYVGTHDSDKEDSE